MLPNATGAPGGMEGLADLAVSNLRKVAPDKEVKRKLIQEAIRPSGQSNGTTPSSER